MKYMLDTDICSYIIRERPLKVFEKFETLEMDAPPIYEESIFQDENEKLNQRYKSNTFLLQICG